MLMPPLIQKWNQLKDEDKDLFPLLEVSRRCSPASERARRRRVSPMMTLMRTGR